MEEAINQTISGKLTEYDDKLVRQLVERVTVREEQFVVRFKSEIEVEMEI